MYTHAHTQQHLYTCTYKYKRMRRYRHLHIWFFTYICSWCEQQNCLTLKMVHIRGFLPKGKVFRKAPELTWHFANFLTSVYFKAHRWQIRRNVTECERIVLVLLTESVKKNCIEIVDKFLVNEKKMMDDGRFDDADENIKETASIQKVESESKTVSLLRKTNWFHVS